MINLRRLFLVGVIALGLVPVVPVTAANAQAGSKKHSPKIDKALSEALNAGGATEHVIITLKPGYRAAMRKQLEDHGDVVKSEYTSIEGLVAEIHSADVDELAGRDEVAAVSLDSNLYADGSNQTNITSLTCFSAWGWPFLRNQPPLRSPTGRQPIRRRRRRWAPRPRCWWMPLPEP